MAVPTLTPVGDGQYRLTGDITLYTVGELAERIVGDIDNGPDLSIDMSGVERADSGALALLIHWYRKAQSAGIGFRVRSMPEDLNGLMKLYDLDEVLGEVLA